MSIEAGPRDDPPPPFDARQALFKGAAWAIAMRWSIKGMGLLSTLALARLLSPGDYGLVAMAMLVVGLVAACTDFGVTASLLRRPHLSRPDIDSAWTLGVMQSIGIGLLIAVASPFAAVFFGEPRISAILQIIAACYVVTSTGNIGLILARHEFNFGLEFRYHVSVKALSVTLTIIAAFVFRDYRALTLGIASSYFFGWVLGYLLHPYRPRWDMSRVSEHWHFGKWLLIGGVGTYISRKTDEVLAGRLGKGHGLGLYSLGSELGQMVTAEVGPAMLKALLPVLAQMPDEARRLALTQKVLAAINTVTLPAGVGLALVSPVAVDVLLGDAWHEAAQYVSVFALYGALQVVPAPVTQLLIVRGYSKQLATLTWIEFCVFIVFALVLTASYGVFGLALARTLACAVAIFVNLWMGVTLCGLTATGYVRALWRPVSACLAMAAGLPFSSHFSAELSSLAGLVFQVLAGSLIYVAWMLLGWLLSGRPDGLETTAIHFLRAKFRFKTGST